MHLGMWTKKMSKTKVQKLLSYKIVDCPGKVTSEFEDETVFFCIRKAGLVIVLNQKKQHVP